MNDTNLRQAESSVTVEGVLAEKKLEMSVNDNGVNVVRGYLTIKVDEINSIRINVSVAEITNAKKTHPAWAGIQTVMNEYKSIADVGEDEADRVRTTGTLNLYHNNTSKRDIVSYQSSFFSRVTKEECDPKAEYSVEMYISAIIPETDKEGDDTGRILVKGYVPTYNSIQPLALVAEAEVGQQIDAIFSPSQTAMFFGNVINSRIEIVKEIPVVIGKPKREVKYDVKNELVITGVSEAYDEESKNAYSAEVIKQAVANREAEIKAAENKASTPTANTKPSGASRGRSMSLM